MSNPLFLRNPEDCCPTCGTFLRSSGNPHVELQACPFGPHDEPSAA